MPGLVLEDWVKKAALCRVIFFEFTMQVYFRRAAFIYALKSVKPVELGIRFPCFSAACRSFCVQKVAERYHD
ncbi:hypothetical protein BHS30_28695 [Klebsiella pneumoniae]|nr:hypothetical protein BHS30_28695 [Klebsiella pneumoniae]